MVSEYVPDAGHLVWLNFTPQAGHEQGGRRPALVLTPAAYNGLTGLMHAAPITSRVKGYPYEVSLPDDLGISGVVLSDHTRSLDWRSRRADFIAKAPAETLAEVRGKLGGLLGSG